MTNMIEGADDNRVHRSARRRRSLAHVASAAIPASSIAFVLAAAAAAAATASASAASSPNFANNGNEGKTKKNPSASRFNRGPPSARASQQERQQRRSFGEKKKNGGAPPPQPPPPTNKDNLERMSTEQLRKVEGQWEEQYLRKTLADDRPQRSDTERNSTAPVDDEEEQQSHRKLMWPWSRGNRIQYWNDLGEDGYRTTLANPYWDYDVWDQAYRMLGGYIDCDVDHRKSKGSGSQDEGEEDGACTRWMMWAAYVDTAKNGEERRRRLQEGDGADGDGGGDDLDCGEEGSSWQLLGVYRQEFYQYLEQISKHLWAIDDARYVVALAGLAYMTDSDCTYVGNSNNGVALYAGVQPLEDGYFQMSLYTDEGCIELDYESGMTYDDFGLTSDLDLNCDVDDDGGHACQPWSSAGEYYNDDNYYNFNDDNAANDNYYNDDAARRLGQYDAYDDVYNDGGNNADDVYDYGGNNDDYNANGDFGYTVSSYDEAEALWQATQEYTLTNMNAVYDTYKSCTPCMDYPTYQDGFFIGDYGTDEDDMINQCWKFYSHDSFTCESNCIALGNAQGTIGDFDYQSGQDMDENTQWVDPVFLYYDNLASDGQEAAAAVFFWISFFLLCSTGYLHYRVRRRINRKYPGLLDGSAGDDMDKNEELLSSDPHCDVEVSVGADGSDSVSAISNASRISTGTPLQSKFESDMRGGGYISPDLDAIKKAKAAALKAQATSPTDVTEVPTADPETVTNTATETDALQGVEIDDDAITRGGVASARNLMAAIEKANEAPNTTRDGEMATADEPKEEEIEIDTEPIDAEDVNRLQATNSEEQATATPSPAPVEKKKSNKNLVHKWLKENLI